MLSLDREGPKDSAYLGKHCTYHDKIAKFTVFIPCTHVSHLICTSANRWLAAACRTRRLGQMQFLASRFHVSWPSVVLRNTRHCAQKLNGASQASLSREQTVTALCKNTVLCTVYYCVQQQTAPQSTVRKVHKVQGPLFRFGRCCFIAAEVQGQPVAPEISTGITTVSPRPPPPPRGGPPLGLSSFSST